jgi:hypothetical protein
VVTIIICRIIKDITESKTRSKLKNALRASDYYAEWLKIYFYYDGIISNLSLKVNTLYASQSVVSCLYHNSSANLHLVDL